MWFIIILVALVLLDFAAVRHGADSRDGHDWHTVDQYAGRFVVR